MTLTKGDVRTIQGLLAEQMQGIEQRFTEFHKEVKSMFQEQADSLSRATAEAVKLRADKQLTEAKCQELAHKGEDRKQHVRDLETRIPTSS